MAAKKKKSRAQAEDSVKGVADMVGHLTVQPHADNSPAPILAKPRKKSKKKSGDSDDDWTMINREELIFGAEVKGKKVTFVDPPGSTDRADSHTDVGWKLQQEDDSHNNNHNPPDQIGPSPAFEKDTTELTEVTDSLASFAAFDPTVPSQNSANDYSMKAPSKPTEYFNPARKEALEAVIHFKKRILERVANQTFLNDTPFVASPYPDDLYLYDSPDNTSEDTAMLELKRAFDLAIMERDPSLAPESETIPLCIAQRAAMYVCGLLRAHDGQFRCALEGLDGGDRVDWVKAKWEERLEDSDQDWLLNKKIEEMEGEKARRHVRDLMEFIFKFKAWGQMLQDECAEMGVEVFPRLD